MLELKRKGLFCKSGLARDGCNWCLGGVEMRDAADVTLIRKINPRAKIGLAIVHEDIYMQTNSMLL